MMIKFFLKNFRLVKVIPVLILVFGSCVSPYEFNPSEFQKALVVEGMITDQPGPYLIKLSNTVSVNDQGGENHWVTGASITIKDDQGNSEALTEKTPGNYYTNVFQGVVGRSYSISISVDDGSTYESVPERLSPVGDFTNLRYEFVQKEDPLTNRQITSKNGFNIYLDSDVLPEQEGRVWWRWTGTFEIFTYPSLKVVPGNGKDFSWVPAPPYCSGYYTIRNVLMGPRFDCQCCTCWVNQFNQKPLISDPNFVSDNKINNQLVGFVEANVRTMYDKYYLEVEQLSASQVVYDFWKRVKSQESNSSKLFQTPPSKTGSNIIVTSKNAIPAIGYFAASSVKKHTLMIDKQNVPYPVLPMDTIAASCNEVYKYSSTIKPAFW